MLRINQPQPTTTNSPTQTSNPTQTQQTTTLANSNITTTTYLTPQQRTALVVNHIQSLMPEGSRRLQSHEITKLASAYFNINPSKSPFMTQEQYEQRHEKATNKIRELLARRNNKINQTNNNQINQQTQPHVEPQTQQNNQAKTSTEPWTRYYQGTINIKNKNITLNFKLHRQTDGTLEGLYQADPGSGRAWRLRGAVERDGDFYLSCVDEGNSSAFKGKFVMGSNSLLVGVFLRGGKDLLSGDAVMELGLQREGSLLEEKKEDPNTNNKTTTLEATILQALPDAAHEMGKSLPKQKERQENLQLILNECKNAKITDPRSIAYIVVTAMWETHFGMQITEQAPDGTNPETYFNNKYDNRTDLGNNQPGDGYKFRGRGFVQLTGREVYDTATKKLAELDIKIDGKHPDLINNPDIVASNKPLAAIITVFGMRDGWFAGPGLQKFTRNHTKEKMYPEADLDFNEARWIVNGNDNSSKKPMRDAAEMLSQEISAANPATGEAKTYWERNEKMRREINAMSANGLSHSELTRIRNGIVIGRADGVAGYFNGNTSEGIDFGRNNINGIDTGLKWQCVEFVRRYYLEKFNMQMGAGKDAKTFYSAGLKDGTNTFDGLVQHNYNHEKEESGFKVKPQKGDVLVLGTNSYGHVAIVVDVTDTDIVIAQQNVPGQGFIQGIEWKLKNDRYELKSNTPLALIRKG